LQEIVPPFTSSKVVVPLLWLKVAPEFIVNDAPKVAFPVGAVNTAPEFRVKVEFMSKVVNEETFQVPATLTELLEVILVIIPVLPPLKVSPASVAVEKPESKEPLFRIRFVVIVRVPVPVRVPFKAKPAAPVTVGLFPMGRLQSELTVFPLVV
jgi:hypothetical protein